MLQGYGRIRHTGRVFHAAKPGYGPRGLHTGPCAQYKKDSDEGRAYEQIANCQKAIEEIKAKEEADRLDAERKAEEYRAAQERAEKKRRKTKAITVLVLRAFAAIVVILFKFIVPEIKLNKAISLLDSGDYEAAFALTDDLFYKGSDERRLRIKYEYEKSMLSWSDIGSVVLFGSYEQDNDISNGPEIIDWTVLDKKDNKLLLISNNALDCQPYNISDTDITWENCSLREWMNDTSGSVDVAWILRSPGNSQYVPRNKS